KQQINDGITPENVQCNVGLQLMIKYNGDPACVKPSTASKLASADWGSIKGEVVMELPSNDNEMELEEEMMMDDDPEEEPQSHKIELKESMEMAGN
ncbi:MAG: hypothetical protein R3230_07030, partial [Nitrosopumilaceae archaeon]|nr:hypothetical protein [Nitrosopumilaceae archaeon]